MVGAVSLAVNAPAAPSCVGSAVFMDTLVSFVVVHRQREDDCQPAMTRAFERFAEVERACSRFDSASELGRLSGTVGVPVAVSELLYEAIACARDVAATTGGAFDPTVGHAMEELGFNRNYRSGEVVLHERASGFGSYRDLELDPLQRTVLLRRPVVLDLGAVAKGLAIDLAAVELSRFGHFAIDAGGDLYLHGLNPEGRPWPVAVRDPRRHEEARETLELSGLAVCTSGDYERPGRDGNHHIVVPGTSSSAVSAVSATVVAPTAMRADALATAAFVLGPTAGVRMLQAQCVEGLVIDSALQSSTTPGWPTLLRETLQRRSEGAEART